jgi:phosphoadenosine phosphosulfate reductase
MQTSFLTNKVQDAIDLLKEHEPDEGYYGATSGGKDSIVVMELAKRAKVKVAWHCHLTTVDPPELLHYIKKYHPYVIFDKPEINMWKLIVQKRMPPTRLVRYCCEYFKENGGNGRVVITGVRKKESHKRSKRNSVECFSRKGHHEIIINPIIYWSESDVWDFIRENNLPYCSLYDEGFKRLGCIGCPMASIKGQKQEFKRWPYMERLYIKAFQNMVDSRIKDGLPTEWKTGQEVMDWWLSPKVVKDDKTLSLFS